MGTAIQHPVPNRVKPSFVIFDIRALCSQPWASECSDVKNCKWRLNPVWHRMRYSCCTHTATVDIKGLSLTTGHTCIAVLLLKPRRVLWRKVYMTLL